MYYVFYHGVVQLVLSFSVLSSQTKSNQTDRHKKVESINAEEQSICQHTGEAIKKERRERKWPGALSLSEMTDFCSLSRALGGREN